MRMKTKSILEELDSIAIHRDRAHVVESRASNIIDSAINLIRTIHENYDQDTAADLEKRLLNAIRTQDPRKFNRGIKKARGK